MAQTVRYILFVNSQVRPGEIVLFAADDANIFSTNFPATPPGFPEAGPDERWSRVVISHSMTLAALAAYEHSYWNMGEQAVQVVTNHNFA